VKPVAVVALGDPGMSDDGVAIRVMGRVRPILAEIALSRRRKPGAGVLSQPPAMPRHDSPEWVRLAMKRPAAAGLAGSSRRAADRSLVSIVEWIEASASPDLLPPVLENRKRIVLIDAISHGMTPGYVQHWHLERPRKVDLHVVRFYRALEEGSLDHLPFWLEEGLPEHGTDLIAIEPYRIEPGNELSPILRSRLASITSQVGGLLLRILEEEGWKVSGRGAEGSRRSRGRAA